MEQPKSTRLSEKSQKRGFSVRRLLIGTVFGIGITLAVIALVRANQPGTDTAPDVSLVPTPQMIRTLPEKLYKAKQASVDLTDEQPPIGLSVAETLTGLSPDELQAQLDDFVALKIQWIRLDFDWAVIQRRGPESYDWERLDRVVAAAHEKDLRLLPILVYTPELAQPADCRSVRCPPADPASFARFAEKAAQRYSSQGIHTWEIWNEPNTSLSWRPAADPAAYTTLLKEAYASITNVDPEAVIISGGLAVIDTSRGSIAPREYLGRMYEAGVASYFDAVAFHPYSFPALPSHRAQWNGWQQMAYTSPSLRSIMESNGDAGKKIWITEYGAPTGGPGSAAEAYIPLTRTSHVTEAYQKEMLADALRSIQKYPWAGPFFWYSYQDLSTSTDTPENFYGIRRADGSTKPAYDAFIEAHSVE